MRGRRVKRREIVRRRLEVLVGVQHHRMDRQMTARCTALAVLGR